MPAPSEESRGAGSPDRRPQQVHAAGDTRTGRAADTMPYLSDHTVAWLADHAQARKLVGSVWDTLAELERTGHDPRPIAALRRVLTRHQPTATGRCHTCRRWRLRRRRFPCIVWDQVRGELLGLFTVDGVPQMTLQ
jgi:hypothetical protein